MKNLYFLSYFLIAFMANAYSCDPVLVSFCESSQDLMQSKVFVGKIINHDTHSTELEIIEILEGQESKNTITIWDGTDLYCNGSFSMSTSHYGDIGDTIFCIVQQITDIENTWDVIGDYRRPSSLVHTTFINIENGAFWDFDKWVYYQEYLDNWSTKCSNILGITPFHPSALKVYPNPASDHLVLEYDQPSQMQYGIFSINGATIQAFTQSSNTKRIDVKHLNPGIYLLKIIDDNGFAAITRFVKT